MPDMWARLLIKNHTAMENCILEITTFLKELLSMEDAKEKVGLSKLMEVIMMEISKIM
jgi:hypothetical protein